MKISPTFKRSRMCREEATVWAEAYMLRLVQDPEHFDADYNIIQSYPQEVIDILSDLSPRVRAFLTN